MLCLMLEDTEWTIHDTTISLHRCHALNKEFSFSGFLAEPLTNWDLFFALKVVSIDLLQEW